MVIPELGPSTASPFPGVEAEERCEPCPTLRCLMEPSVVRGVAAADAPCNLIATFGCGVHIPVHASILRTAFRLWMDSRTVAGLHPEHAAGYPNRGRSARNKQACVARGWWLESHPLVARTFKHSPPKDRRSTGPAARTFQRATARWRCCVWVTNHRGFLGSSFRLTFYAKASYNVRVRRGCACTGSGPTPV